MHIPFRNTPHSSLFKATYQRMIPKSKLVAAAPWHFYLYLCVGIYCFCFSVELVLERYCIVEGCEWVFLSVGRREGEGVKVKEEFIVVSKGWVGVSILLYSIIYFDWIDIESAVMNRDIHAGVHVLRVSLFDLYLHFAKKGCKSRLRSDSHSHT